MMLVAQEKTWRGSVDAERWMRIGLGFAEDDCAEEGDGSGEGDEEERAEDPVGKDLR